MPEAKEPCARKALSPCDCSCQSSRFAVCCVCRPARFRPRCHCGSLTSNCPCLVDCLAAAFVKVGGGQCTCKLEPKARPGYCKWATTYIRTPVEPLTSRECQAACEKHDGCYAFTSSLANMTPRVCHMFGDDLKAARDCFQTGASEHRYFNSYRTALPPTVCNNAFVGVVGLGSSAQEPSLMCVQKTTSAKKWRFVEPPAPKTTITTTINTPTVPPNPMATSTDPASAASPEHGSTTDGPTPTTQSTNQRAQIDICHAASTCATCLAASLTLVITCNLCTHTLMMNVRSNSTLRCNSVHTTLRLRMWCREKDSSTRWFAGDDGTSAKQHSRHNFQTAHPATEHAPTREPARNQRQRECDKCRRPGPQARARRRARQRVFGRRRHGLL